MPGLPFCAVAILFQLDAAHFPTKAAVTFACDPFFPRAGQTLLRHLHTFSVAATVVHQTAVYLLTVFSFKPSVTAAFKFRESLLISYASASTIAFLARLLFLVIRDTTWPAIADMSLAHPCLSALSCLTGARRPRRPLDS